jgi:molybdopterin converting factor small subunit
MHVEFLGIPRERAGIPEVEIEAVTLGQVLATLTMRFPGLQGLITPAGLHPSVAANLNGDAFVSDLATSIAAEDYLIILSADVGG